MGCRWIWRNKVRSEDRVICRRTELMTMMSVRGVSGAQMMRLKGWPWNIAWACGSDRQILRNRSLIIFSLTYSARECLALLYFWGGTLNQLDSSAAQLFDDKHLPTMESPSFTHIIAIRVIEDVHWFVTSRRDQKTNTYIVLNSIALVSTAIYFQPKPTGTQPHSEQREEAKSPIIETSDTR